MNGETTSSVSFCQKHQEERVPYSSPKRKSGVKMTCRSCSRDAERRRRERNQELEVILPNQSEAPICQIHQIPKTATRSIGRTLGYRWNCRSCGAETAKAWAEKNQEKKVVSQRESAWRRLGIVDFTYDDYLRLLDEQNNQCAICSKDSPNHVDHDHETGVVRGVLCGGCNKGLGHFYDNPDLLTRASTYLILKSY